MSDNEKTSLGVKLKSFAGEFTQHWNTPKPGRYVPYKEYLWDFLAVGGDYALKRVLGYLSFSQWCFLVIFYYEVPVLTFSVISILFLIQGKFWALINMIVCDNLGFLPKKTERLLYTLYLFFATLGVLFLVFDFSTIFSIPASFESYVTSLPGMNVRSLFKLFAAHWIAVGWGGARAIFIRKKWLPKLGRYKLFAYFNVLPCMLFVLLISWLPLYEKPLTERIWQLFLLFQLYGIYPCWDGAVNISNTISPDPHERMLVRAYPEKLSHLLNSILVESMLPILAAALTGDITNINTYRYIIPIMMMVCTVVMFAGLGNIKERIPQPPVEKKKYIPFWNGVHGIFKNKYIWINALSELIDALGNGSLGIKDIILIYTWREKGIVMVIVKNLVAMMGNPGAFLSPWIRKRFQYRTLIIFKRFVLAGQSLGYIIACWVFSDNYFMSGLIMLISLCLGDMLNSAISLAQTDMDIRLKDYQMYLSGERLENYQGTIKDWFVSPFTTLISLVIPLLFYRIGFTSDYDILFVDSIRSKCMVVSIAFDLVGHILCCLPYILFWDYSDEKHKKVIAVLEERERRANAGATQEEIYAVTVDDTALRESGESAE
ncbi:MAG: MFS transporter [Clostridia bacterium]|nr:MFS transporter [Clostridia bacterium]